MTLLYVAIGLTAGIVLFNMGHTKGYQQGYQASTTHSALTIKSFLDWLPADERMLFTNKLRDFQLEHFKAVVMRALDSESER